MKSSVIRLSQGCHVVMRIALLASVIVGVSGGVAQAAAPLAGTVISNQAAATYTDGSAIQRTATSNTVTTIVQQVSAMTLTTNQSQVAAPGAPVNFPHTVTNTGNGVDSFTLSASNTPGTMTLPSPIYYIDANCNGVADNQVAITRINNVAAGASACFVATTTVPVGATTGNSATIGVTATSVLPGAVVSASNTDTVTVTSQAVINVTKAISVSSGAPGTTVTYTLTYTNTGNAAASNVVLADFLPTGMTYVPGSALLNGAATTDLVAAGSVVGDMFDYGVTVAGRITAIVPTVAAGQSGQLTFNATVAAATPASVLNNQARFCFNDGAVQQPVAANPACTPTNTATTPTAGSGNPTNTASFTVLQAAGVAANADPVVATQNGSGGAGDVVTVASAPQGATVVFNDYIHNTGNGTDTFNVALSGSTFPAGTTFLLFKSDGVTPLTDTNAIPDGVVDTGPIAAGGAYLVVVKAILPSGVSGGGAYTNVLTATSTVNATLSDPVTNSLTTITANKVDLTNGAPALPAGAGQATTAQGLGANTGTATPVNVNPGAGATYPLFITNTSSVADTYGLTSTAVPAGWTVAYFVDGGAGNCSTLGGTFTNTGVLVSGASKLVCAVVTPPSSATPGQTPITFTTTSPTTGASDTKAEIVNVNTVRAISLTPPNAGQVFPSGSVVYSHILTNNGNVVEGSAGTATLTSAGSTITLTDPLLGAATGWNNVVYLDNTAAGVVGVLDPADTVISGVALNTVLAAGVAPGASIRLFVKVLSPANAAAGDINTSNLTATTTGIAAAVAPDTTTVIVGQVVLAKTQALDANCDGVADTGLFSNAVIGATATPNVGAIPGACLMYQVTATNVGVAPVLSVVVNDATPANTTYINTPVAAAVTLGTLAALPANGATGTITANVGTLTPGQAATLSFSVKINP